MGCWTSPHLETRPLSVVLLSVFPEEEDEENAFLEAMSATVMKNNPRRVVVCLVIV